MLCLRFDLGELSSENVSIVMLPIELWVKVIVALTLLLILFNGKGVRFRPRIFAYASHLPENLLSGGATRNPTCRCEPHRPHGSVGQVRRPASVEHEIPH